METDALALPDILEKVFKFSDKRTLVCCSVVNKDWSHGANKYIWESLNSLQPLIKLLAPLTICFTAVPTWEIDHKNPISWRRFNVYAPLVKYLSISAKIDRYGRSILEAVALWRPSFSLLPQLKELHIDFRQKSGFPQGYLLELAMTFFGENITKLSLTVDNIEQISTLCGNGYSSFLAFLDAIPNRVPSLRHLKLDCLSVDNICNTIYARNFTGIRKCIMDLLPSLLNIETIEFCPTFASVLMTTTLSNIKSLKSLKLRCNQYHTVTHDPAAALVYIMSTLGVLVDSSTLEDLTLDAQYDETIPIFQLRTLLSLSLKRLDIRLPNFDRIHAQLLISNVGICYPRLEVLRLERRPDDLEGELAVIDFDAIKPLMKLKQMRTFALSHISGWRINDSDFEELIRQWPFLEEFHLVYPPSHPPTSSLQVLHALAKHCPNMRKLTLPLELDSPASNSILSDLGGNTEYQFSDLQYLNFGTSLVSASGSESKVASIAVFLTGLSVPSAALNIGHSFNDDGRRGADQQLLDEIKKYMVISSYYIQHIKRLRYRVKSLEAEAE